MIAVPHVRICECLRDVTCFTSPNIIFFLEEPPNISYLEELPNISYLHVWFKISPHIIVYVENVKYYFSIKNITKDLSVSIIFPLYFGPSFIIAWLMRCYIYPVNILVYTAMFSLPQYSQIKY